MKVSKPAKHPTGEQLLNESDFRLIKWIKQTDIERRHANLLKFAIVLPAVGVGITLFFAFTLGVERAATFGVCALMAGVILGAGWSQNRAFRVLKRLVADIDLDELERQSNPLKPHD